MITLSALVNGALGAIAVHLVWRGVKAVRAWFAGIRRIQREADARIGAGRRCKHGTLRTLEGTCGGCRLDTLKEFEAVERAKQAQGAAWTGGHGAVWGSTSTLWVNPEDET